jgi:acetolactate synthase I/III small subunit
MATPRKLSNTLLEVLGDRVAIFKVLQKFELRETARTGKISLPCELEVNTELLKTLQIKA